MSVRQLRRGIPPGRRPLACYHEAGHCLIRWYFGHRFHGVTVLAIEEIRRNKRIIDRRGRPITDVEGLVEGYDIGPPPDLGPEAFEGMEGPPERLAQVRQSQRIGLEVMLVECHAGIVAEARYRKCGVDALVLTGGNADMASARDVLDRWFPEATAREHAAVLAKSRAQALVHSEAGWRAITAIAEALMERGELSWEDADALCAAAYGHKQPSLKAWKESWPPELAMIRAGRVPCIKTSGP